MIDLGEWSERAAVLEFDHGMTRFAAETEAARRLGFRRFEVLNAKRERDSQEARNHGSAVERNDANNMSGVLSASAEQDRQVLECNLSAGRDCVPVLALRA